VFESPLLNEYVERRQCEAHTFLAGRCPNPADYAVGAMPDCDCTYDEPDYYCARCLDVFMNRSIRGLCDGCHQENTITLTEPVRIR
jgi:hypothetical protein